MYNWIILLYTWNKHKIVINYTSIKKIKNTDIWTPFQVILVELIWGVRTSWFVKDLQVQRRLRTTVQKEEEAVRGICDQRLSSKDSWGNILMNLWKSGSHLSVVSQIFSVMKMLVVVVQLPSHVWLFATPWTTARQASLFLTISQSLPKFMPMESVMPFSHLILCHLLLLLPSIFLSIRVFSSELTVHFRSLSFSTSPSSEYSGLMSFKVTGLMSPSSTIIWKHQFFGAQPFLWSNSHICLYVTTGKTIILTMWIFVSRVMSLLFNTLSRFVIAFLSRSNCLLISWLQILSTVILEPKKKKLVTASIIPPSICHEVTGPDVMILVFFCFFLILSFLRTLHYDPSILGGPAGHGS